MLYVRNYDADYYVNENYDIDDKGKIKMYAVEIQNEAGDVICYTSFRSEEKAEKYIKEKNLQQ